MVHKANQRYLKEEQLHNENLKFVRRMEQIHHRPWNQGLVGGELKVPHPSHRQPIRKEISTPSQYNLIVKGSLNFAARKNENQRINLENLKLFQKLAVAKGNLNTKEFK